LKLFRWQEQGNKNWRLSLQRLAASPTDDELRRQLSGLLETARAKVNRHYAAMGTAHVPLRFEIGMNAAIDGETIADSITYAAEEAFQRFKLLDFGSLLSVVTTYEWSAWANKAFQQMTRLLEWRLESGWKRPSQEAVADFCDGMRLPEFLKDSDGKRNVHSALLKRLIPFQRAKVRSTGVPCLERLVRGLLEGSH
jgi:hypothetical protein